MNSTRNAPYALLFAVAATFALMAPAQAQSGAGGWTGWLGCWEPATGPFAEPSFSGSALCVVPGSSGSVDFVTVEAGEVVGRETLPASGTVRVDRDGCAGVGEIRWSADGRRQFRASDLECAGDLRRETDAVVAILPNGDWVSAEAMAVAGETSVRTVRYQPTALSPALTETERQTIRDLSLATETARAAATVAVDFDDVIEAVDVAGEDAVQGWLIEREQGFDMDADALVQLADAGVPAEVIDLMVALSYPNVFAVNRASGEGERIDVDGRRPPRGWGSPWYYPIYGRGFYPGYYGGWYGRPVIIVRDGAGRPNRSSGGRAVKGRGYTRPRSGGTDAPSTGSSPSVGRSGGGDRSGDSTPASTGRTAKPRGS